MCAISYHGNGSCEHALHGLGGLALGILRPLNSHVRSWRSVDISENNYKKKVDELVKRKAYVIFKYLINLIEVSLFLTWWFDASGTITLDPSIVRESVTGK